MQFEPKTEKQLQEEVLLPKGIYPFDVQRAEAKRSKAGNDMIALELRVYTPDGKERMIRDWLMAQMGFKLFHFCAYTGLSQKYDAGTLQSHDCEGKSGFVEIVVKDDKSGQYGPSNSVKDYVRPEMKKDGGRVQLTESQLANLPQGVPPPTEDVPF
jgi:hypothetical protein